MGAFGEFTFGPTELVGWGLQVLLIALVSRRAAGPMRLPEPGISFCLLILCLGWVLRLTYLFALASDGFMYWIGDDPLRWLMSWSWLHSPPDGLTHVTVWMPGTTFIHGVAMTLIPNPLYASKLLSASYSVMSLAGVLVFAQALFRNRVISLACVVFLAPFWIDILLSSGTMAEMPTVGAMLGGAGALLYGLRLPVGRRRTLVLLCAAGSFAIATAFHMVAWIELTGILLFLLPVFSRSMAGSRLMRFRSWVLFCAVSTSWCFVWAIDQWTSTGSPFTVFREVGELTGRKLGGPLDLAAVLGPVASLAELAVVMVAVVALLVLVGLCFVAPEEDKRVLGRFGAAQLRRVRWGAALLALVTGALAFSVVQGWLSEISPKERELVVTNWAVFPVSLVYCLHYYLPLVLNGVFVALRRYESDDRAPRLVLACMGFVFAILMTTAVMGGANVTPFRTVLVLASALLPFAMAPLFNRAPSDRVVASVDDQHAVQGAPRGAWVTIGIALLVFGANFTANHTRINSELTGPSILKSPLPTLSVFGIEHDVSHKAADMAALGSWMRTELKRPGYLSPENLSHPFELALLFDLSGLNRTLIEYQVGDPARFAHPHWLETPVGQTRDQLLAKLVPGQVVISDHEIGVPELRPIARLGDYWVYERVVRE
jgi:hypothetical protein